MKPAWDALGDEYKDSSSVLIGDAYCTVEKDLCSKYGVSGYPTIKYFTEETGKDGAAYNGGRDFDQLKTFVSDNLEQKCLIEAPADGCTDREQGYITKMQEKGAAAVKKQLTRLQGMKGKSMKPDLKKWLLQRLAILTQLDAKSEL